MDARNRATKPENRLFLKRGVMSRRGLDRESVQRLGWRLGAVYIDMSCPAPSFSHRLEIFVLATNRFFC
jgi:hypothetical protein